MTEENKKKESMISLVRKMNEFDEGVSDLSLEDMKEVVGELIPEKIDGCYDFEQAVKACIVVCDNEIKELQKKKKSLEATLKNHDSYCKYFGKESGMPFIRGKERTLYFSKRKTTKVRDINIDTQDYIYLNNLKDGTVKREYKFDKKLLKDLAIKNPDVKDKYTEESVSDIKTYRLNKEIK